MIKKLSILFLLTLSTATLKSQNTTIPEADPFCSDTGILFDNTSAIIIEEIDPVEDIFYSLVGQIEGSLSSDLLLDFAAIFGSNENLQSNGYIFNFIN